MFLKYLMVSCTAMALSFVVAPTVEAASGKTTTQAKAGKKSVKVAKSSKSARIKQASIKKTSRKSVAAVPREAAMPDMDALGLPNVKSTAVLVQDQYTGEVLFERNSSAIVPIASITKLMTAMVVLDAKLEAIRQAATDDLRLYPSYSAQELRDAVAHNHGVKANNVFLGNGSDEVLAHVFSALFLRGVRPVLLPDITYSFYTTYCSYFGVPADIVPLSEDFTLNVQDYVRKRSLPPAGIIFANPNAPTGIPLSLTDIETILAAKDAQTSGDNSDLIYETADLWFHSLVMLSHLGESADAVLNELARRFNMSGHDEKAARSNT